jgi:hypothetical protein
MRKETDQGPMEKGGGMTGGKTVVIAERHYGEQNHKEET